MLTALEEEEAMGSGSRDRERVVRGQRRAEGLWDLGSISGFLTFTCVSAFTMRPGIEPM